MYVFYVLLERVRVVIEKDKEKIYRIIMWVIISNVYYLSICNLKRVYINNRWWCWESQIKVGSPPFPASSF